MIFARSDWLLKREIVFAMLFPSKHCFEFRARVFSPFVKNEATILAGYPLIWYMLKRLFGEER